MVVRVNFAGIGLALLVACALSLAAMALLSVRIQQTDDPHFAFLTWNLMLAWIPFGLAAVLYAAHRAAAPGWALVAGLVPWLLFLPNAPYIITDFIHLAPDTRVPLWFDFALLAAFASAGLLLGLASIFVVQTIVTERVGALAGWTLSTGSFVLSAVGIYVGRYLRYNTWDAWREPGDLWTLTLARLADPLGNPTLIAIIVLFTGFLLFAYLTLFLVAGAVARLAHAPAAARRARSTWR